MLLSTLHKFKVANSVRCSSSYPLNRTQRKFFISATLILNRMRDYRLQTPRTQLPKQKTTAQSDVRLQQIIPSGKPLPPLNRLHSLSYIFLCIYTPRPRHKIEGDIKQVGNNRFFHRFGTKLRKGWKIVGEECCVNGE